MNGYRENAFSKYGLLSFSCSWQNPLLWSHYCENHKGICLGFDVPDDDKILDVDYVKKRPEKLRNKSTLFSKDKITINVLAADVFRYKMAEWAYENECRMIEELPKRDLVTGLYFCKFKDIELNLKEVIIGAFCKTSIDEIKSVLPKNSDVEIIKVGLNLREYQVVNIDELPPH